MAWLMRSPWMIGKGRPQKGSQVAGSGSVMPSRVVFGRHVFVGRGEVHAARLPCFRRQRTL